MDNIIVYSDTREKIPWVFYDENIKVKSKKLNTGDYTVKGLEDKLCIERKYNILELSGNFSEKRMARVIDSLSGFQYKYFICDFNMEDVFTFPLCYSILSVDKKLDESLQLHSDHLLSFLIEMQSEHNIHVVFTGNSERSAVYVTRLIYSILNSEEHTRNLPLWLKRKKK